MTPSESNELSRPYASSQADHDRLSRLIERLTEADHTTDESADWPSCLWQILIDEGAPLWSMPLEFGGESCDRPTLVGRNAAIAQGSLTAAFILSQHDAAVRRLVVAERGREVADAWLKDIAAGKAFGTVGISQLTTSRRHGAQAMRATGTADGGFLLDGVMPWVTAAERADVFVTGGVLQDGQQLLAAIPRERVGLSIEAPFPLAALGASRTAEVRCNDLKVDPTEILVGPAENVMAIPGLAGTGGLETTALALGLARAALLALRQESKLRDELDEPTQALAEEWQVRWDELMAIATNHPDALTPQEARARGNDLVLRLTQANLTAFKGSGFVQGHPAQRWARQALFFLVWSCPSPVANAAMRELAGLCPA